MTDAHTLILQRLGAQRDTHRASVATRLDTAAQHEADARGTLPVGTRVFDAQTAQDGQVVPSAFGTARGSGQIAIRLDSGQVIARKRDDLIVRPTPPAVAP